MQAMLKQSCRLPLAWQDVVETMLDIMAAGLNASQELHPARGDKAPAAIGFIVEQVRYNALTQAPGLPRNLP